jgi:tetratricopeptide (TPR) repeat protein
MENVLQKLQKGKVEEVRATARELIRKDREDPEGWFLMGMVSHYKGNEGHALECFERALYLQKSEKFHKAKSVAHMALFEFEEAAHDLKKALALKKDPESHFLLSIALMFLSHPEASDEMLEAYRLNPGKTREMLQNFFHAFFRDDPSIPEKEKKEIMRMLSGEK